MFNWTHNSEIRFGANFFFDQKCVFSPKFGNRAKRGQKGPKRALPVIEKIGTKSYFTLVGLI